MVNTPYPTGKAEVTAEVGGIRNVKRYQSVQRDFRSEFSLQHCNMQRQDAGLAASISSSQSSLD